MAKLNREAVEDFTQQTGGKSFDEMKAHTASNEFNDNVANELLNDLDNHLFRQVIMDSFKIRSRILDMFTVDGLNVSSGEEIIENQLIPESQYDPSQFIPTQTKFANQLRMFLKTVDKVKGQLHINRDIISRAFTSIPQFNSFVDNYLAQMTKSYELYVYNHIIADIDTSLNRAIYPSVVDTKTDPNGYTPLQQSMIQFLKELQKMTDVPTNEYNMDGRGRKKNFIALDEFVMLVNPTTYNKINTEALAKIFNPQMIDIQKIDTLKLAGLPDNKIIVISKQGYRIFTRIKAMSSQAFALNMIITNVLHIGLTRGIISWFPGFAFMLEDKQTPMMQIKITGTPTGFDASGTDMSGIGVAMSYLNGTGDRAVQADEGVLVRTIDDESRDIVSDFLFIADKSKLPTDLPNDLMKGFTSFAGTDTKTPLIDSKSTFCGGLTKGKSYTTLIGSRMCGDPNNAYKFPNIAVASPPPLKFVAAAKASSRRAKAQK